MSPKVRGTSNFSCGGGLLKFLELVLCYRLFLMSVFQTFRDLLYRRTYCHAGWEMVSHRRHGIHRTMRSWIVSRRRRRFSQTWFFVNVITRLVLQDRGSVFLCNQLTKISRFAELILCISVSSVCYDS